MFNRYDLKLMQDALRQQYAKEYVQRENDGLNKENIEAQLGGFIDVLVKINIQLASDRT